MEQEQITDNFEIRTPTVYAMYPGWFTLIMILHINPTLSGPLRSFSYKWCNSTVIEMFREIGGIGYSGYPFDQSHIEIEPNQAFMWDIWRFKDGGVGGL